MPHNIYELLLTFMNKIISIGKAAQENLNLIQFHRAEPGDTILIKSFPYQEKKFH